MLDYVVLECSLAFCMMQKDLILGVYLLLF